MDEDNDIFDLFLSIIEQIHQTKSSKHTQINRKDLNYETDNPVRENQKSIQVER